MPAYAIANLSNVDLNADIATTDETLVPFDGAAILVEGVDEDYRAASFLNG